MFFSLCLLCAVRNALRQLVVVLPCCMLLSITAGHVVAISLSTHSVGLYSSFACSLVFAMPLMSLYKLHMPWQSGALVISHRRSSAMLLLSLHKQFMPCLVLPFASNASIVRAYCTHRRSTFVLAVVFGLCSMHGTFMMVSSHHFCTNSSCNV